MSYPLVDRQQPNPFHLNANKMASRLKTKRNVILTELVAETFFASNWTWDRRFSVLQAVVNVSCFPFGVFLLLHDLKIDERSEQEP